MEPTAHRLQPGRRGMTLLEVVVVLVILGMLLALVLGILRSANRELAVPVAQTHVASMAKTVRNRARLDRAPAWMLVETREKRISMLVREPFGMWHFESLAGRGRDRVVPGAYGRDAVVRSRSGGGAGVSLGSGRVGRGIRMTPDATLELPKLPLWHPEQGVVVDFWLNGPRTTSEQTLFEIGSKVRLSIGSVRFRVRECGQCRRWIPYRLRRCPLCGYRQPRPQRIREGRALALKARVGGREVETYENFPEFSWTRVTLVIVRSEARLYVNEVLKAAEPVKFRWGGPQRMRFGAERGGVRGTLDELAVYLVIPRETYVLPPNVEVEVLRPAKTGKDGSFMLHFDIEGRLDAARHEKAVELKLTDTSSGQTGKVRFKLNGEVEVLEVGTEEPPKEEGGEDGAPAGPRAGDSRRSGRVPWIAPFRGV